MKVRCPAAGILLMVLAGCSLSRPAAPAMDAGVAIRGTVRGGQGPIGGMHVYLFAANTMGSGAGSVSLLNAAYTGLSDSVGAHVLSGADGSFSISGDYTCTAGTQVYLNGLGGDPGNGTNSSAGLMAVLGELSHGGQFCDGDAVRGDE